MSYRFTSIIDQLSEAEKTLLLDVAFNNTFKLTMYAAAKNVEQQLGNLNPHEFKTPEEFQHYYSELKNLRDMYMDVCNGLLKVREFAQGVGLVDNAQQQPQQSVEEEKVNV